MRMRNPGGLCGLILCWSTCVGAQGIHKCRDADGRIAYQDQPCAIESLPVPPIAPPPRDPYLPDLRTPERTDLPAPPLAVAPPPHAPPPAMYRCMRENGETYTTSRSTPPLRYVPAWVLGATTTTSNLPRSPGREAAEAAIGGALVPWRDQCTPLSVGEICAQWMQDLDRARDMAQRSFTAEREVQERAAAALQGQLAAHCGR
jgi:hypothetical protein